MEKVKGNVTAGLDTLYVVDDCSSCFGLYDCIGVVPVNDPSLNWKPWPKSMPLTYPKMLNLELFMKVIWAKVSHLV